MPGSVENSSATAASSSTRPNSLEPVPIQRAVEILAELGSPVEGTPKHQELGTLLHERRFKLKGLSSDDGSAAKLALVFATFTDKADSLPTPGLRFLAKVSRRVPPAAFTRLLSSATSRWDDQIPKEIDHLITGLKLDVYGTFLETFGLEAVLEGYFCLFPSSQMHRLLRNPTDENKKAARILLSKEGMLAIGLKYIDGNSMRKGRPGDSDENLLALVEICLECDKAGFFEHLEESHKLQLNGAYDKCLIRHAARNGKMQALRTICEALLEEKPDLLKEVLTAKNSPILGAMYEDQNHVLDYLLPIAVRLDIVLEIRDYQGRNLLAHVMVIVEDNALNALKKWLPRETLAAMASERNNGLTLFQQRAVDPFKRGHKDEAWHYPSAENMGFVYSLLTPEEQEEAIEWLLEKGVRNLCGIAAHGTPELFPFLYGLIADRLPAKTLFSNSNNGGVLYHAAQNRHGAQFLLNLLREQDAEVIARALAPTANGNTPFHQAALKGPADTILGLAEAAHAAGDWTAAGCCKATQVVPNLLSSSIHLNGIDEVRATITALRSYFPKGLEKILTVTKGVQSPLEAAINCLSTQILDAVTELYLASPPDIIAAALIHKGKGSSLMEKLTRPWPGAKLACTLLARLSDEQIEATLQVKGLQELMQSPEFFELLMRRFPDANRRLTILMRARRLVSACHFEPGKKMDAFLGAAGSQPYAQLLFHDNQDPEVWDIYPQLKSTFERKLAPIQAELNGGGADYQLEMTLRLFQTRMQRTFVRLATAEYSREETAQLIPYLDRIQHLHFSEQLNVLTSIINRLIPGRELLRPSEDYQAPAKKQPILHRLVIEDLKQAGLDPALPMQLLEYIEAQGSKFSPTSDSGRELLNLLIALHSHSGGKQWQDDVLAVLARVMSADPLAELRAFEQLLHCAPKELSQERLSTHNDSLQLVAQRHLREFLPVGDMEDFAERYQAFSSRVRDPNSLLSYAGQVSEYDDVHKDLGTCMRQVLLGTFQKERYSPDGNPHLEALYQVEDTQLQSKLPTLCEDMGRQTVGGAEKKKASFDHVRAFIRDKVLEDKLLDPKAFSYIHQYLEFFTEAGKVTDPDGLKEVSTACGMAQRDRARALRQEEREERAAGTRKKGDPAKRLGDQEYLCRELQSQLISACTRPTTKEIITNLTNAIDIAKKIKGDLSALIGELKGFRTSLAAAERSTVEDYEVFLTDDFWDLMRCGTDVGGSCQHMTRSYGMNRCLLGYLMNGFVFPIVVKKPGSEYIEARRLLFVNLDEDGKPVLFLERSYSNNSNAAIDAAMVRMAKEVADHLKIPLYSRSVEGSGPTATLEVKKGAAARIYSDAGGGERRSAFKISDARLVHQPSSAASSSTASSSDAASSTDAPARHGNCQIC